MKHTSFLRGLTQLTLYTKLHFFISVYSKMVSFSCNYCQDVVKKPKILNHSQQCGSDSYTCVDCMQTFNLSTIKGHTTCVTETQKYQGKWQPKKPAPTNNKNSNEAKDGKKTNEDKKTEEEEKPPCKKPRTEQPAEEN